MSDIKRLAKEAHIFCPECNGTLTVAVHDESCKSYISGECDPDCPVRVPCDWPGHAAIDALAAAGEEAERRYDGFVMMTPAAAESMRDRIDALTRQNEALRKALRNVADVQDDTLAVVSQSTLFTLRRDARDALKETP